MNIENTQRRPRNWKSVQRTEPKTYTNLPQLRTPNDADATFRPSR